MLDYLAEDPTFIKHIIIGDETCVYEFDENWKLKNKTEKTKIRWMH